MMTLEDAIKHCKDVALSCTNKECALEHFQLLKWLQEYSNMLEKQKEQRPAEKHKLLIGEDYGVDGLYHAIRILEKTLGDVDGYQTDDGILEHEIAIDTVKALYKKKPNGWTENDSQIKGAIVEHLVDNNLTEWANWLETQIKLYPCKDCDYENTNIHQNDFTPKDKPKFKVGDWCIDNEDGVIFQIVKVLDNTYVYKTNEGKEYSCTHYSLENDAKLWTIQDVKDGDVLSAHECIVVFKEIDGLNIKCHCTYHYMNNPSFHVDTLQNKTAFHPATKEQRDQLFQKIREAGYEWNSEKNELIKIKNTNYADVVNDLPKLTDEDIDNLNKVQSWYRCERVISAAEAEKLVNWIKSFYDKLSLFQKMRKKEIKKISEWTEEDEELYQDALDAFEALANDLNPSEDWGKLYDWLKSLKQKMEKQQ